MKRQDIAWHVANSVIALFLVALTGLAALSGLLPTLALLVLVLGAVWGVLRSLWGWFRGFAKTPPHRGLALANGLSWMVLATYFWVATPRVILPPGDLNQIAMLLLGAAGIRLVSEMIPRRRVVWGLHAMLFFLAAWCGWELLTYRMAPRNPVVLAAPFEGDWVTVNGGPAAMVNHHWYVPGQRHALDILGVWPDGRNVNGDRGDLTAYACFGRTLVAPANGIVVRAEGSRPDMAIGTTDTEQIIGNHVVIDIGAGRYVLMAHLQKDSLQVEEGSLVTCGQVLGKCGNSGNTSEPHLHLQVSDGPDVLTFPTTFPIAFRGSDVPLRRDERLIGIAPQCGAPKR